LIDPKQELVHDCLWGFWTIDGWTMRSNGSVMMSPPFN